MSCDRTDVVKTIQICALVGFAVVGACVAGWCKAKATQQACANAISETAIPAAVSTNSVDELAEKIDSCDMKLGIILRKVTELEKAVKAK